MVAKKAPKKFTEKKDTKSEQQLAIQSANTSSYSLLTPLEVGKYVYVKNPLDSTMKHFSTKDQKFVDYIKELTALGLGSKLKKDVYELILKDDGWKETYEFLANNSAFHLDSNNQ